MSIETAAAQQDYDHHDGRDEPGGQISCRIWASFRCRLTAPMALRERLSGFSRNELITTCASFRPCELVGPLAAAKRSLRSLARRIQALNAELKELMADLDGLTQAACPGLRQSYGIGIDGAAVLLTAAGDNPERIRSEAAFAAICGANPLCTATIR